MIQRVSNVHKKQCLVLCNTRAQESLIPNQYARDVGYKGCPASMLIRGLGLGGKKKSQISVKIAAAPNREITGEFRPHAMEQIRSEAMQGCGAGAGRSRNFWLEPEPELEPVY
jgi:hypothetical protein